jgi:hypothetical protein
MIEYTPESILLNNIYIPFYIIPKKRILNANDNLKIETGLNGLKSVITLCDGENPINPFIDISKYDTETKDWFWYDSEGLPLRISRHSNGVDWTLTSLYKVGKYYNKKLTFNPDVLLYNQFGKNLGFYSKVTAIDDIATTDDIKVYSGRPIFLELFGSVVKDVTDYDTFNTDITLIDIKANSNKEFYYDNIINKLYTNQNLAGFDQSQIKLHCFITYNSIKIKCLMSGNSGLKSYSTPTVDYYIAKLHGQYLKG